MKTLNVNLNVKTIVVIKIRETILSPTRFKVINYEIIVRIMRCSFSSIWNNFPFTLFSFSPPNIVQQAWNNIALRSFTSPVPSFSPSHTTQSQHWKKCLSLWIIECRKLYRFFHCSFKIPIQGDTALQCGKQAALSFIAPRLQLWNFNEKKIQNTE